MLSPDTKFEQLYDHYKDTCAQIQDLIEKRDKIFLPLVIVLVLMSFQLHSPEEMSQTISQLVASEMELKSPINVSYIGTILWFTLFVLIARYFQATINLARRYDYVGILEEQLSAFYENGVFTRENKHWRSHFPLFSKWNWIMYTIIFPIIIASIILFKIINELSNLESISLLVLINFEIFLAITLATIFYMLAIHFRK